MRTNKANVNSSKLKVITLGDVDKTLELGESGATIIITVAASANRTITLPTLAGTDGITGAHYRVVWGVSSNSAATIIQTASSAELIKGTAVYYRSGVNDSSDDMTNVQANGTSHRILTVTNNIEPGSMIELVTDGSHWYICNCRLAVVPDPAFS